MFKSFILSNAVLIIRDSECSTLRKQELHALATCVKPIIFKRIIRPIYFFIYTIRIVPLNGFTILALFAWLEYTLMISDPGIRPQCLTKPQCFVYCTWTPFSITSIVQFCIPVSMTSSCSIITLFVFCLNCLPSIFGVKHDHCFVNNILFQLWSSNRNQNSSIKN